MPFSFPVGLVTVIKTDTISAAALNSASKIPATQIVVQIHAAFDIALKSGVCSLIATQLLHDHDCLGGLHGAKLHWARLHGALNHDTRSHSFNRHSARLI